ncbi:MAG: MATE family efflux transporter [Clostridiales bacterium]|nr:MATE family efflux transporter [Clostridiales bacterium]
MFRHKDMIFRPCLLNRAFFCANICTARRMCRERQAERVRNRTLNMTSGNPARLLIVFALPMLIGNIFQQFYNLVDSIIVGRLISADALGAIGATSSVTFLFFALCNGIASGGGVITSQFFGMGDAGQVRKSIVNTAYVMLVMPAVVGGIAFVLAESMLRLLNTPEQILPDALAYTRAMCIGIIFVSVYNFASSMLRALGDSRTPLYFLIFSCFLNAGLDLLFVAVFHQGVLGAGIATVISQFVSAVICLVYAVRKNPYFKPRKDELKLDMHLVRQIVRLGVPLSLQFSLIAVSSMALQRVVNGFGPVAVDAFTATNRIEQMIHQPYQTLSAALATYCGQNWGAGDRKRVLQGYRKALLMMAVLTAVMVPLVRIFGRGIMGIFVSSGDENSAAVIDLGTQGLKLTSLFYLFLGMIYVVRGILNGLGDAKFALLNGVVEIIGRFTVPYLLTTTLGIGVTGIWWSSGIVWFLSGFTAWLRYIGYKRKVGLAA